MKTTARKIVLLLALSTLAVLTSAPYAYSEATTAKVGVLSLALSNGGQTITVNVYAQALPGNQLPALVKFTLTISYKAAGSGGFVTFYQGSVVAQSDGTRAQASFSAPYQGKGNYFFQVYAYDAGTNAFLGFGQFDPRAGGDNGPAGFFVDD